MKLNFLEKEMLENFIQQMKANTKLPQGLIDDIKNLHLEDKLTKGDGLKNLIEGFMPQGIIDEDK